MKTVHGENPRETFFSGLAILDTGRQDMGMLTAESLCGPRDLS